MNIEFIDKFDRKKAVEILPVYEKVPLKEEINLDIGLVLPLNFAFVCISIIVFLIIYGCTHNEVAASIATIATYIVQIIAVIIVITCIYNKNKNARKRELNQIAEILNGNQPLTLEACEQMANFDNIGYVVFTYLLSFFYNFQDMVNKIGPEKITEINLDTNTLYYISEDNIILKKYFPLGSSPRTRIVTTFADDNSEKCDIKIILTNDKIIFAEKKKDLDT